MPEFSNDTSAGNFTFQQAYTTANQLVGWSYDASGNIVKDVLSNACTFDGEGRMFTASGYTYVYDGTGERAAKLGPVATDYVTFGGREVARYSAGQWTDLIYGANGLLAEVPGSQTGSPVYRMVDQLGSAVGTFDATSVVLSTQDYAPFGQLFSGGSTDPYRFTGKERDSESGNDYFGARYYGSNMGRFMMPDWSAKQDPVPYAKLDDPQSLNLYAYARNNPLRNIDPDGHDWLFNLLQSQTSNVQNALFQNQMAQQAAQQQNQLSKPGASGGKGKGNGADIPKKFVIDYSRTQNKGSFSYFWYALENSSGKVLTGDGYGVEEHIKLIHDFGMQEADGTSEGKFVPTVDGYSRDAVGLVEPPGKGTNMDFVVLQSFTVRYKGTDYNLNSTFYHQTLDVDGQVTNKVWYATQ